MLTEEGKKIPVPVEISARHVHLSREHVDSLFGKGHALTPEFMLSQPGQFASAEKVTIAGPKSSFEGVRVLGPERKESQVEISLSDRIKVGIQAPLRESGDIGGTPGVKLIGPAGEITLEKGVIVAIRHIHMTPDDAARFGLADKQVVRVRIDGERELIYGDVVIRVNPNFKLAFHLDTDEGNAANAGKAVFGYIEAIQDHV